MATPTPTLVPDQFEAIRTARQNQPTPPPETIEQKINTCISKFDSVTRRNRMARFYVWFQSELFWRGIHLFTYDPDLGTVRIWDEEDQDLYNPINLVMWAEDGSLRAPGELVKGRPE